MSSNTKIMDVLLRAGNDSYLQEYVKPTTSDYFIMADNGKNDVLGNDCWVGRYYNDNRDGLKEGFALVPFFHIDDDFRYSHYRCISYPSKKTALEVLERLKPKLKEYFGCDRWVVKRLQTIFYLEDCDDK